MLHASLASPTQSLPPCAGAGLLQVLVRIPPPHALEHSPYLDHPPSTTNTHTYKRESTRVSNQAISICHTSNTKQTSPFVHINEPHLDKLACCRRESRRLRKSCRRSQAQGYCKFSSESLRHNPLSIPRNGTIHRRVYCLW